MNNNIMFRKVKPKDAEAYVKLINLVWRITYKHIFPEEVFIEMENKTEERIKNFPNNFYNDDKRICYVALDNEVIVGVMYGTMDSSYEYFKENDYADLVSLYILPNYQGMGIGNKLRDIFINWIKDNHGTKYVIGVLKENKNARKVYEKWGGILNSYKHLMYKLGVGYEEVFYTYSL